MATVLIVEDNLEHVELVHRVLAASGYKVLAACDAKTGLQMATERLPDLILLDLGLPDVDGQTLLGQMRDIPELAHVPVVAITAWPPGTDPQMVEDAGFDGCLSKPIRFFTLADQIAAYLHNAAHTEAEGEDQDGRRS